MLYWFCSFTTHLEVQHDQGIPSGRPRSLHVRGDDILLVRERAQLFEQPPCGRVGRLRDELRLPVLGVPAADERPQGAASAPVLPDRRVDGLRRRYAVRRLDDAYGCRLPQIRERRGLGPDDSALGSWLRRFRGDLRRDDVHPPCMDPVRRPRLIRLSTKTVGGRFFYKYSISASSPDVIHLFCATSEVYSGSYSKLN